MYSIRNFKHRLKNPVLPLVWAEKPLLKLSVFTSACILIMLVELNKDLM